VRTVAGLVEASERLPTIHDYLAWRIAHDPTLPCLSKVYDLFPGGWSAVNRGACGPEYEKPASVKE
jgi:hypothetical protein